MDNPDFLAQVQAGGLDQAPPGIVVSCHRGRRGEVATQQLAAAGLERLANVLGGLSAWGRAGLPVDRPAGGGGSEAGGVVSGSEAGVGNAPA